MITNKKPILFDVIFEIIGLFERHRYWIAAAGVRLGSQLPVTSSSAAICV